MHLSRTIDRELLGDLITASSDNPLLDEELSSPRPAQFIRGLKSYWKKQDDTIVYDGSLCWLYAYLKSRHSYERIIPGYFEKIFDIDFSKFDGYINEQDKGYVRRNKKAKSLEFDEIFLGICEEEYSEEEEEQKYEASLLELENNPEKFTMRQDDTKPESSLEKSSSKRKKTGRRVDYEKADRKKRFSGKISEMKMYAIFSKDSNKKNVKWVSQYAAKMSETFRRGYNKDGKDGLGYDITYEEDGKLFYVEVKGTSEDTQSFTISLKEIQTAIEKRDVYKIAFVNYALDNEKNYWEDFGNIFIGFDISCIEKKILIDFFSYQPNGLTITF